MPMLYNSVYLSIFIAFLYGLVTPTHVYDVSGLSQAPLVCKTCIFEKKLVFQTLTIFVNILSICSTICKCLTIFVNIYIYIHV